MVRKLVFYRARRGLFGLALIALGVGAFRNVQRAHAQGPTAEGSSVVLQEVVTKADNTKVLSAVYKYATRADGSSAFIGIRDTSTAEAPVRMLQLASGSQGYISDARQQKYMAPLSAEANPAAPPNLRKPSSLCSRGSATFKESAVGEEQISGYRAEKVVWGSRTAWYALDYGCALVQEHFEFSDGQKSDKYLVLLRPGEPDSSLFSVPSSYTDVPQSAFTNP